MHTDRCKPFIELYAEGKTTYEIGELLGVSQTTACNRLKEAGIKARSKWGHYCKIHPSESVRLYQTGLNICQTAKAIGVTPHAVKMRLVAAGVTIRPAKATPRYGPDNHVWKGGRFKGKDGYIYVRQSGPGDNKHRPEHRNVAERMLARPLRKDEIVHHLNGIRSDNRPSNLVVTTRKHHEHYTYVKALQAKIRSLEASFAKTPNSPFGD